ncbi:hypothetical protein M9H77_00918 [Catharanthus roseus]|uniref:Uncharacterized protein n=1 Tax=Catharanthus roseus TaxID=4058 RepID=A0ACC0C4H3_CATRO|nr:hypothetical protein M9H77_00918 [Catharanthus roseus]
MSKLLYFGESEGSLYAIVGSYHQEVLDVLELAKDYSNWILKFRLDLTPLTIMYPSMINIRLNHSLFYSFRIPCLLVSKKKIVTSVADEVILYDIKNTIVKEPANAQPVEPFQYPYERWCAVMFGWSHSFKFYETQACV